jgi:cell division septation protein DedD
METQLDTAFLPSNGVTAELYRAAIGPRAQDYYLKHFLRFDSDGKTSATWHWPAYWATLNWLIYRRMWARALGYAAALSALALLIFGVGKLVLSYSDASALILFLILLTAAFVFPGMYANAWFYNFCSSKISAALRATEDIQGACNMLSDSASDKRRWNALVGANLIVATLLAAAANFFYDFPQEKKSLAQATTRRVGEAPSNLGKPPAVVAGAAGPTDAKAMEPLVARIPPVSEPTTQALASAQAPSAVQTPAPSVAKTARVARHWHVQVGAFSQEANAQSVRQKVGEIGLPILDEPKDLPAGRLIRVRVGPFDSKAEAEKAALRLRALELPTVLVRQ